jgi:hypothetical protein
MKTSNSLEGGPLDVQGAVQAQMDQYYSAIAQEKENRAKARNWQITVFVALVAYLNSNRSGTATAFPMLLGVTGMFWLVEGFYQSLVLAYFTRVGRLEELLANRTALPKQVPLDLFFERGFHTVSAKEKAVLYLKACFFSKSIVLFNTLFIVLSALVSFVLLCHPASAEP